MPCCRAFTLAVGKERATLLALCHQSHHAAHRPRLASLQCGVAHPVALHLHHVAAVDVGNVGRVEVGGVYAHRRLQSGKELAAQQRRATRVAHDPWRRLCLAHVYGVNHRHDMIHPHVLARRDAHLGAQVVGAVAQHGTPLHAQVAAREHGLYALAAEPLRAFGGLGVGGVVLCGHAGELHVLRRELSAVGKAYAEKVCRGHEVHGLAAVESQRAVDDGVGCLQKAVGKGEVFSVTLQRSHACLFLLWKHDLLCLGGCRHSR